MNTCIVSSTQRGMPENRQSPTVRRCGAENPADSLHSAGAAPRPASCLAVNAERAGHDPGPLHAACLAQRRASPCVHSEVHVRQHAATHALGIRRLRRLNCVPAAGARATRAAARRKRSRRFAVPLHRHIETSRSRAGYRRVVVYQQATQRCAPWRARMHPRRAKRILGMLGILCALACTPNDTQPITSGAQAAPVCLPYPTDDNTAPRTVAATEQTPALQSSPSPPPSGAVSATDPLATAMRGFARAIETRDTGALLGYVSKQRGLTFLDTIAEPHQKTHLTYEELARDLQTRDLQQGWYSVLLGDDDESFALATACSAGRTWKRAGKRKFVLPDDDLDSRLFVSWRREGARWVIDTIAQPAG
jgi:hypothetical protein